MCTTIAERLLDSEEHACEGAIPQIAYDAAEEIKRLEAALATTQAALAQAVQHVQDRDKLISELLGNAGRVLANWSSNQLADSVNILRSSLTGHYLWIQQGDTELQRKYVFAGNDPHGATADILREHPDARVISCYDEIWTEDGYTLHVRADGSLVDDLNPDQRDLLYSDLDELIETGIEFTGRPAM